MVKKRTIFTPDTIAEHERPLGRMLSESSGQPFEPLRSLEEAQAQPDGYVILQGDDGGQIYVVTPASYIRCSSRALERLLGDLDEIAWPGNYEDMRKVFFERLTPGAGVAGGMGGGAARSEPWVHEEFIAQGLLTAILAVLRARGRGSPQFFVHARRRRMSFVERERETNQERRTRRPSVHMSTVRLLPQGKCGTSATDSAVRIGPVRHRGLLAPLELVPVSSTRRTSWDRRPLCGRA